MRNDYPELSWLREQGYRLTPQRLAILDVLRNTHGHLNPTEIYQRVAQAIPGLTEATVYRTLNFLAEQGLVLVAHLGRGRLAYELTEHDHHPQVRKVLRDLSRHNSRSRDLSCSYSQLHPRPSQKCRFVSGSHDTRVSFLERVD